jgi:hypothetical protein
MQLESMDHAWELAEEGGMPSLESAPGWPSSTEPSRAFQRRLLEGVDPALFRTLQYRLLILALVVGDGAALVAAFGLAYYACLQWSPYSSDYWAGYYAVEVGLIAGAWLLIFACFGLYDKQLLLGGTQEYENVINGCTAGTMLVMLIEFLRRDHLAVSWGWLLMACGLAVLLVGGTRLLARRIAYRLRAHGYFLSPTLIVGVNGEGLALAEKLLSWNTSGLKLLGFVDGGTETGTHVLDGLRVLGSKTELRELVSTYGIGELVIATTALSREELLEIFQAFGNSPDVNLRLSSGLYEIMTTGLQVKETDHVPLVTVDRVRLKGIFVVLKAALDHAVALPALIALSPLLLLIALAVKLGSPRVCKNELQIERQPVRAADGVREPRFDGH